MVEVKYRQFLVRNNRKKHGMFRTQTYYENSTDCEEDYPSPQYTILCPMTDHAISRKMIKEGAKK